MENLESGDKEHQDLISSFPDHLNRRPLTPLLPNPNPNPNKKHPPPPSQQPPLKRSRKAETIDGAEGQSVSVDTHQIVRSVVVRFLADTIVCPISSPRLLGLIEDDDMLTPFEKLVFKEDGAINVLETVLRSLAKDNCFLLEDIFCWGMSWVMIDKIDWVRLLKEAKAAVPMVAPLNEHQRLRLFVLDLLHKKGCIDYGEPRLKYHSRRSEFPEVRLRRKIFPHTDVNLGDCVFLHTCRRIETCKYVHYEPDTTPDVSPNQ